MAPSLFCLSLAAAAVKSMSLSCLFWQRRPGPWHSSVNCCSGRNTRSSTEELCKDVK